MRKGLGSALVSLADDDQARLPEAGRRAVALRAREMCAAEPSDPIVAPPNALCCIEHRVQPGGLTVLGQPGGLPGHCSRRILALLESPSDPTGDPRATCGLCHRISGPPALRVLVGLVLAGWIRKTPGRTSMAHNVATPLLSFIPRALQVIRIHSVRRRVPSDLPWQGRAVTIRVAARRFRCRNPVCARQTFAERLAGVMALSSRRTGRHLDIQRHLALALGGHRRHLRKLSNGGRSRPARRTRIACLW